MIGCVILFVLYLTAMAGSECMARTGYREMENKTEAAMAIALHDTIVREQIPIATGE